MPDERQIPPSPLCPNWCDRPAHGWLELPGSVTKVCSHAVDVGEDGTVLVQRYAAVENGALIVMPPTVRFEYVGELAPPSAQALGAALCRLARTADPSLTSVAS